MSHPGLNNRFYTIELRQAIDKIVKQTSDTEIIANEAANVVIREKEVNNDIKTFTLYTSANFDDKVFYNTKFDVVALSADTNL